MTANEANASLFNFNMADSFFGESTEVRRGGSAISGPGFVAAWDYDSQDYGFEQYGRDEVAVASVTFAKPTGWTPQIDDLFINPAGEQFSFISISEYDNFSITAKLKKITHQTTGHLKK